VLNSLSNFINQGGEKFMACEDCNKRSKKTGQPCGEFPCAKLKKEETAAWDSLTRRARQRMFVDDSQLLATADPQELAAAGAFDN
jgi:hypothetical protein